MGFTQEIVVNYDDVREAKYNEKPFGASSSSKGTKTLSDNLVAYSSVKQATLYVNVGKGDKAVEIRNRFLALPKDTIGRPNNIAFISG